MEQVKNLVKNLTVSDGAYKAPGRLGDPTVTLETDPRVRPDLLKAAKALGLAADNSGGEYPDLNDMAALESISRASHTGFGGVYNIPNDLPEDANEPEVEEKEILIDGADGNKVKIWVYRTKEATSTPKPAICYIHGGGMVINDAYLKPHTRWCKSLAILGTVAFLVEFRNAFQMDGKHYPFPAGLNDCAAAVKYIAAHKSELGVSKIVIQGESGGGNLTLATALRANREGWVNSIDGVYGSLPYISGAYAWSDERKLKELPSLKENEGYFLNAPMMAAMAKYYSPGEGEMENPEAWPYWASVDRMKGLPPHFMSMDELDPLRDEGIAYGRRLLEAGVDATSEVNLGITHGTSLIFRQAVPDVHRKALRHIATFAKSL